jgi:hypothetical protein
MEDAPQASDKPRSTIADKSALDALRWDWGDAYEIGLDDEHGWHAKRRDGLGGLLTAPGSDELYKAIADDYAFRPVPRDLPGAAGPHEATPRELSAYSMEGPNTGQVANLANIFHYPAEGLCEGCGEVIRATRFGDGWHHTGRKPGDPP